MAKSKAKEVVVKRKLHNHDKPFAEDSSRFREDWDEEACIAELRRIVEEHPDTVISRNFFRVHSNISEATWNRYFGTWDEFKRQANVTLSRQQHKLERDIAKHASVDHYRVLHRELEPYAGKYNVKNKARYQTLMACFDLHDIEVDPFWLRVWLEAVRRVKPSYIVWGGDIFDLPEFGKYTVDPREWSVTERIKFAHEKILEPTRKLAPDAQMDFIAGNHEVRILNHLADATPALRAVLSELHGMSFQKLLLLDDLKINLTCRGDLAAWLKNDRKKEVAKNYKVFLESYCIHHFPDGRNLGVPGANGHNHKHLVWAMHNETFGSYSWHQSGCGHRRSASYCNGEIWNMGFPIVHIDTLRRQSIVEYVYVTDMACVGGEFYHREKDEV